MSPDELTAEQAEALARRDGTFAGVSAALVASLLGARVYKFNRNTTIITGALTGLLSGWQFTQAFRSSNLAQIRAQRMRAAATEHMQDSSPTIMSPSPQSSS